MRVPKGFKLPFVDKILYLKILLVSEALKNFYLIKKMQTNKTFFKKRKRKLCLFLSDAAETSSGQEGEVLGREPTWKRLRWRELVQEKIGYEIGFIEELTVMLDIKL